MDFNHRSGTIKAFIMNVLHYDATGNSTGFIKFISVVFEIYDGIYKD